MTQKIMPKLKTKKAASKRIKKTSSGKLKRRRASRSHLKAHKSASRKRSYRKNFNVSDSDSKNIEKLTPYL